MDSQISQSLFRMQFFPQCFNTFQADFFLRGGREVFESFPWLFLSGFFSVPSVAVFFKGSWVLSLAVSFLFVFPFPPHLLLTIVLLPEAAAAGVCGASPQATHTPNNTRNDLGSEVHLRVVQNEIVNRPPRHVSVSNQAARSIR